jgi:branched-chain amino acid transport system permease protein
MSGEAIFVIMLGGLNTFLGPMVGATILTLLNHFVTEFTEYYGLVLGGIILFYVLALRRGLLDILVAWADEWRRGRSKLELRKDLLDVMVTRAQDGRSEHSKSKSI